MANVTLLDSPRPKIRLHEEPSKTDWPPVQAEKRRVWISARCYDVVIALLILAVAAVALFCVGALGQP